jgi:1-acyl-sn-glycerol-3-phosphate acyltransferase
MRTIRLASFTAAFAALTLLLLPLQWVAVRREMRLSRAIPLRYHRWIARLIGLKVTVHGEPAAGRPLLLVSNHVSWKDIVVLGGVLPLSFIAKAEVARWPIFGTLAKLQRTVFIDRTRRTATGAATREVAERLSSGDAIVLFGEGTTGDGNRLLPFRSPLLGAAREAAGGEGRVLVQPVAIAYLRRQGLPLHRPDKASVAWYGDMDLLPHLKSNVTGGPLDVAVAFGEPIAFGPDGDRKEITRRVEAEVRRMLEALRRGESADPVSSRDESV